jgi:hypothetical protein
VLGEATCVAEPGAVETEGVVLVMAGNEGADTNARDPPAWTTVTGPGAANPEKAKLAVSTAKQTATTPARDLDTNPLASAPRAPAPASRLDRFREPFFRSRSGNGHFAAAEVRRYRPGLPYTAAPVPRSRGWGIHEDDNAGVPAA